MRIKRVSAGLFVLLLTLMLAAVAVPAALAQSGFRPIVLPATTSVAPNALPDLAKLASAPRYAIDLTLDPANLSYTGRQTITYTNTDTTPLTDIVLRVFPNSCALYGCGELKVTGATVGGQPATTTSDLENTALRVTLPRPVAPGQKVDVTLDFQGRVPTNFGPDRQGYGIYNYGPALQTLMLANAYPVLAVRQNGQWVADPVYPDGDAVFSPTAFYDVSVTLPGGWSPVATGSVISDVGADGTRTVRYSSGPARDFMLAVAPNWNKVSQQVGETTVNSYYLGDTQAAAEKALDVGVKSMEIYSQRFGPYPFRQLDIVPAPLFKAAGVEYPGLVLIEAAYYSKPNDPSFETTVAHEVAHQWWYSTVGNDVIKSPWLDEALTQYASAIYFEDRYGKDRFNRLISGWERAVDSLVAKGEDDIVGEGLAHFEGGNRYGPVVYIKGPLFFHAIRQRLGDEAFYRGLQSYYQQNKYGIATPERLVAAFNGAGGPRIDDLFDKWILKAEGR
ncbi:MAG: M1 family metallopeptidase [Anaerolineae bacterium]|nr:M1 family metallopeptidase [Anaerolineae bacterium]